MVEINGKIIIVGYQEKNKEPFWNMEVIDKIFKPGNSIKLNGWIRDIDKIKEKFGDGVKINNMKLTLNIYWRNGSAFDSYMITTVLFGLIGVALAKLAVAMFISAVIIGGSYLSINYPPGFNISLQLVINLTAGVYTFNILYSYINGYWRPIGCTLP